MSQTLEAQIFGKYHLLEKIATGGMAEVWRARFDGMAGFEKILVIKKKRRKKYRRRNGHRQDYTEIQIDEIVLPN